MMKRKMRYTIPAVLAALLAAALLLWGCSPFKPSLASLTASALKNTEKAQSAQMTADLSAQVKVSQAALGVGMDVALDILTDTEMTKQPQRVKGKSDIQIGVFGQNESIKSEFYVDFPEEGTTVTYTRPEGGKWTRSTAVREKESEEESTGSDINPLKMGAGIVKMMVENPLNAQLDDELSTVNEKEAYRITCTVKGEFLKSLLDNADSEDKEEDKSLKEALDQVNWDGIEIPAEIYIYKEGKLPARLFMDLKTVGKELTGFLMSDMLDELPVDGIELDVDQCTLDLVFDRYNEIDPIEIPQEALDAEESEDAAGGILDFLGE